MHVATVAWLGLMKTVDGNLLRVCLNVDSLFDPVRAFLFL